MARETGLTTAVVQRIIELSGPRPNVNTGRRQALPFEEIHETLRRQFSDYRIPNAVDLELRWMQRYRPSPAADSQASRGRGQSGSVNPQAPPRGGHRGQQMSIQQVHALSYMPSQPGRGAQFGGPQPGYGAQYQGPQQGSRGGPSGASQYGHGGQYGAPQPGSGYGYPLGANQQASRGAFSNPAPGQGGFPPADPRDPLFQVADRGGAQPPPPYDYRYSTGRGGSNGQS